MTDDSFHVAMAFRPSACAKKWKMTSQKVHCYDLRWIVKNARFYLLKGNSPCSGMLEICDPETDRYKLRLSFQLRQIPKSRNRLELLGSVDGERRSNAAKRITFKSHIEMQETGRAVEHEITVCDVPKAGFGCGMYRLDELLSTTSGLIVNDTLTIVVSVTVDLNDREVRLADQPTSPIEAAFAKAFVDETLSDVVLRSSDGREFRAHKLLLSIRSPVFRAMFESGLKESTKSEVEIADCPADVVEQMLLFVYVGTTPEVGDDLLFDLLKVADKYDMKDLLEVCGSKLALMINVDNAADVLSLADSFGAKNLRASAMDWTARHIYDVLKSPGWKTLSDAQPRLVGEVLREVAEFLNQLS